MEAINNKPETNSIVTEIQLFDAYIRYIGIYDILKLEKV